MMVYQTRSWGCDACDSSRISVVHVTWSLSWLIWTICGNIHSLLNIMPKGRCALLWVPMLQRDADTEDDMKTRNYNPWSSWMDQGCFSLKNYGGIDEHCWTFEYREKERRDTSFCIILGNCYHTDLMVEVKNMTGVLETEVPGSPGHKWLGPVLRDPPCTGRGGMMCVWGGGDKGSGIADQFNMEDRVGTNSFFFFNFTQLNMNMIYSKSTTLVVFLPYHLYL